MTRVALALSILGLVLGGGTAVAQGPGAPIDQAGWAARKQHVTLSNGIRLAYVELGDPAGPPPVDATFVAHADMEMVAVPPHVWRAIPRAFLDLPVGRYASEVAAPVLILSGGADPLFPAEHHRALMAAYPGAEARIFPELGHNLIVERPHQVGPRLAAFLAQRP